MNAGLGSDEKRSTSYPELERFPERLRESMDGVGMKAFGKKCGVSEGALFSYLSGNTFPTLDRLALIARGAGKPIAWFLGVEVAAEAALQEASQPTRPDVGTLRAAVEVLDRALAEADATTDAAGRAELLVAIYELLEQGSAISAAQRVVATMLRAASRAAGAPVKQG